MVQIFLDVLYWGKRPKILGNYTLDSLQSRYYSSQKKKFFQRNVYFFPDLWGYLFVCMVFLSTSQLTNLLYT